MAIYGILSRNVEYCASDLSCRVEASVRTPIQPEEHRMEKKKFSSIPLCGRVSSLEIRGVHISCNLDLTLHSNDFELATLTQDNIVTKLHLISRERRE
jgi:hypothetical protein